MGLNFVPPTGGDGEGEARFPETIEEYAAYWDRADVRLAAADAKLKETGLVIDIGNKDAISARGFAEILNDDRIPALPDPTASTTVAGVFSLNNSTNLTTSKGEAVVKTGIFDPDQLSIAFYGIQGEQNDVLPASSISEFVENRYGGYTDEELGKAISLVNDIDTTYYGSSTLLNKLNDILSDNAISESRIRSVYQSGGFYTEGLGDVTINGQMYGIILTAYDADKAATDLENDTGDYTDYEIADMIDYLDDGINNGVFSLDDVAKILQNNNLSPERAVDLLFTNDPNIADLYGSPELFPSRGAALWEEAVNQSEDVGDIWDNIHGNGDYQKLAESIDKFALSESNAEAAWSNTTLSSSELADISANLSRVDKPLGFGEIRHHRAVDTGYVESVGGDDETLWAGG